MGSVLKNRGAGFLFLCALTLVWANVCSGLVLHDDNQLPSGSRPADAVVGRWSSNGSCVAIDPDHITIEVGVNIKEEQGKAKDSALFPVSMPDPNPAEIERCPCV